MIVPAKILAGISLQGIIDAETTSPPNLQLPVFPPSAFTSFLSSPSLHATTLCFPRMKANNLLILSVTASSLSLPLNLCFVSFSMPLNYNDKIHFITANINFFLCLTNQTKFRTTCSITIT